MIGEFQRMDPDWVGAFRPSKIIIDDPRKDGETHFSVKQSRLSFEGFAPTAVGEVPARFQLLEHAWDYEYENRSNIVDSYVRLLRKKIDRPFGTQSIQTIRGAGYRLRENGGASRTTSSGAWTNSKPWCNPLWRRWMRAPVAITRIR